MYNVDFTFEPLQCVWSFKRCHLQPQFFHHLDAHHVYCSTLIDHQIDTSFVHDATSVKKSDLANAFLLHQYVLAQHVDA